MGAAHSGIGFRAVDNTDWLKTAAIVLVTVDHYGYFFVEDGEWWSVVGRLAAPTFFFLMGYAQTRAVPLRWLGLGVVLTVLDSWNQSWAWVAPNILFSFAFIRLARPFAQEFVQRHGGAAFALLAAALFALLPLTDNVVDYGAEGWLWALFGLCQRIHVDRRPAVVIATGQSAASRARARNMTASMALTPLLVCLVAAVAYLWREQIEFSFSQVQFAVFTLGVGVLALGLLMFRRGPSLVQPPKAIAAVLQFVGRRTLEIYAIELAAFELIVKFAPSFALLPVADAGPASPDGET
jgi:hypothetical protein